jgi:hypothetical protein
MKTRALLVMTLAACTGATLAAQDRVILFESSVLSGAGPSLPGEIREVEITRGGRGWTELRSVPLPPHRMLGGPVALADGSRILWLAGNALSSVLVQYEMATGRASIVDVGTFDSAAKLLADKTAIRIYVVEPTRVTFLDERLRPESLVLSGPKRTFRAFAGDGILTLLRAQANDPEAVTVSTSTREVVRTTPLASTGNNGLAVSRDGQRLYTACACYDGTSTAYRIDLTSLVTGQLLARAEASVLSLFALDDQSGMLLTEEHGPGRRALVVRDPLTLAVVGHLGVGVVDGRRQFSVAQTPRERSILVFDRSQEPSYFGDSCAPGSPPAARIDVFDGDTFQPVNRIDLNSRCPAIVPLPR